jgi:CubicO group peptidase (beta-lactamase class C family)
MAGEDGGFVLAPPFDPSHKLDGAGFLATAEDLARFGAALIGPSLLSERARAEMFRPVPLADGTPTEFALGLRHSVQARRTIRHQPGGGIGISSWLFLSSGATGDRPALESANRSGWRALAPGDRRRLPGRAGARVNPGAGSSV